MALDNSGKEQLECINEEVKEKTDADVLVNGVDEDEADVIGEEELAEQERIKAYKENKAIKRKTLNTRHSAIVDYWSDKFIGYNGVIKTTEDSPNENDIKVVGDIGEPVCWACEKPFCKYDGCYEEWQKLWDSKYIVSHLNRCHIIPRALSHNDEPNNLFLMCERCHRESPDTTNTKAFFRWVYDRRKNYCFGNMLPRTFLSKVDEELERRGMPNSETIINHLEKNNLNLNAEEAREYMSKNANSHGSRYNDNTLVIVFTDYLLSIYAPAIYM